MRLITWNVNCQNKRIPELLEYALSFQPDVLCLQEVPEAMMQLLKTKTGYHIACCFDFHNHHANKSAYICTLTKVRPTSWK